MFGGKPFGPNSFNFRDMSMKKQNSDYFTLQPIPGSSPTASLAADMSSNLHVDQR
jgi:M-phase inducer tyrosine phosphatase